MVVVLMAVSQIVQTHEHPFFYTHQYFQVYPKYLYNSTDNGMLTWGKIGVARYFLTPLYITLHVCNK